MGKKLGIVATCGTLSMIAALSLSSCQTVAAVTAKSFSVSAGYDEKKNVDVTAGVFMMNRLPVDVLQIYRNVERGDGKVSYGIYNSFRDDLHAMRPYFSVVAFIVDGKRTDFYGKSFGSEDIMQAKTSEDGYFFSNKPALGNSLVASESELITDSDPAATDGAS